MKISIDETKEEWIKGDANLTERDRVGADPAMIGAKTWIDMEKERS
jgi:hypothetical protein